MKRFRTRLNLTSLENRVTPAATLSYLNGNLTVTGDNTGNVIAVAATGSNQLSVSVNSIGMGSFNVTGNLAINSGNGADTVTIALGANTFSGNVTINTGTTSTGNDNVAISNGALTGRLSVTTSSHNDVVTLTNLNATGILNSFTGGAGTDTLTIVNSNLSDLNLINGFNSISLLGGTAGGVIINSQSEGIATNVVFNSAISVTGDITMITGAGNDSLVLSGTFGGNITFVGGNGMNMFQTFNATVSGNISAILGNGVDAVGMINSTVNGSVQFNTGDGNNNYLLSDIASSVNGHFSITAGNGNDFVGNIATYIPASAGAAAPHFGINVAGNLNVNLGNGSNTFLLNTVANSIGGNISITSGAGADAVQVAQTYGGSKLKVALGAGNDFFVWGALAGVLSADIDGGTGANTYVQTPPTIFWSQNLVNF